MAEDKGKEKEKFDFTSEGEGYISLDEAILSARRLVRQDEQRYLSRTGWEGIVWSTSESQAGDASIKVILQFRRPDRGLSDEQNGLEEFLFDYNGELQDRQVLFWPNNSIEPTATGAIPNLQMTTGTASYIFDGAAHFENGEYELAISEFDKSILLESDSPDAFNNRGCSYGRLGQFQNAINDFSEAISLDSDFRRAYTNRGLSYSNLGELETQNPYKRQQWFQSAISDYTKSILLGAPLDPRTYSYRGHAYYSLGQSKKAFDDYYQATLQAPNDVNAYIYRGVSNFFLDQWHKAIADFTKATLLDPNDALAYHNRGAIYSWLGQALDANINYSKARQLNPNYDEVFNGRGVCFRELNQYKLADEATACSLDSQYC